MWRQGPNVKHWLNWTCLGRSEHVRLGPVDTDGDLCAGRTKLLEESAVRPDPQVLLRDFHLRTEINQLLSSAHYYYFLTITSSVLTYNTQVTRARSGVQTKKKSCNGDHVVLHKWLVKKTTSPYETNLPDTDQDFFEDTFWVWYHRQTCTSLRRVITLTFFKNNELEFNPWGLFSHLVKQRVEHADAEHPACSKRQPEHEGQVGALITLYLKTMKQEGNKTHWETTLFTATCHILLFC